MNKLLRKYVYGLLCPDTYMCKYVGVTVNIKRRYSQHCSIPMNSGRNKRERWLKSLIKNNKKPILFIISQPTPDYEQQEINWIKYYRYYNSEELVNTADGVNDVRHATNAPTSFKTRGKITAAAYILSIMKSDERSFRKRGDIETANKINQRYLKTLEAINKIKKDGRIHILEERFSHLIG